MTGKIIYKLIVIQILLATLVIFVTGFLSYLIMERQLIKNQNEVLQANTKTLMLMTFDYFENKETTLSKLASGQAIKHYNKSYSPYTLQEPLIEHNPIFPVLAYINNEGREEVRTVQGKINLTLKDLSKSKLWLDSREKPNRLIMSVPRYSSTLSTQVIDLVYHSTNFFDESLGYLKGSIDLSDFSKLVQEVVQDKAVFAVILDDQGNIAFTPQAKKLATSLKEDPKTSKALADILTSQDSFVGEDQILGELSIISMLTMPKYGWKIVTGVRKSDFLLPLQLLRNFLLAVFFVIIGFSIVIAYFFGRTISRPISRLTETITTISREKDLSRRVELVSNDELGVLSQSFNTMLDYLQNAQNEINAAKSYSENIIQSMTDAVIVINAEARIQTLNRSALNLLGYETPELIEKPISTIMKLDSPENQNDEPKIDELILKENMKSIEKTYVTKSGENIPMLFSSSLMKDKNGTIQGAVCAAHDITERKLLEEATRLAKEQTEIINKELQIENVERKKIELELKKSHDNLEKIVEERTAELAQKNRDLQTEITRRIDAAEILLLAKNQAEIANEAKDEFMANISHELRTPMHGILSYSKFGIKKIETVSQEKLLHYFSQIHKAGNRLMVFLNDLLDLSKLENKNFPINLEPNDMVEIIKAVVSEFKPTMGEKNLQLELIPQGVSSNVSCDANRIRQVLRNLLSNAIKFTPDGKKIQISLDTTILYSKTFISDRLTPYALLVKIRDEGPGIPEEETETVFDKFIQSSRTKTGAGGTGLGLAICAEIIKSHKGKIWVENNPDIGSSFFFALPIS